jgi:hypothetical protein
MTTKTLSHRPSTRPARTKALAAPVPAARQEPTAAEIAELVERLPPAAFRSLVQAIQKAQRARPDLSALAVEARLLRRACKTLHMILTADSYNVGPVESVLRDLERATFGGTPGYLRAERLYRATH